MNFIISAETVNFSSDRVWTFLLQIGILAVTVLIGNIVRTKVPFIKKLFIPSAVIGGVIALALKAIPAVKQYIDGELMQTITYHCLGLGFAAMALKTEKSNKKVSTVKIVESGAIMASSYMLQAIVGLVVSLSMYFLADYFYAAGLILPMGFGQSTGSALSWGSNYETNYGFEGGASFGLAVASIGFIVGSVIGVIYLNIVCKKYNLRRRANVLSKQSIEIESDLMPESESIDIFTVQICLVIVAYLLSYGFMRLLALTGIKAIGDLAWGLNFLWALVFAFLIKSVINLLRKKNAIKAQPVSNVLMDRISGFMFDFMIVGGIVAIDFEDIYKNLWMLVIMCAVGTIATLVYVRQATKVYKGYELESFLTNFGTVTGTVSTGMILLREVDPEYRTPAASNIVLQNIPSIALLSPLLLTLGYAGSSVKSAVIMLCVYSTLFVGYSLFLFRRRIFRKHYASKPDEVWIESEDSADKDILQ